MRVAETDPLIIHDRPQKIYDVSYQPFLAAIVILNSHRLISLFSRPG